MLTRILYVSTINPDLSVSAITRMVAASQRRNRQLDLTGALLKFDGHFAQVIEGREEVVQELMAKIARDPRHSDMNAHNCGSITRRAFADWDMAFIISPECGINVTGYLDGKVTPDQLVEAMLLYVEEAKVAPL